VVEPGNDYNFVVPFRVELAPGDYTVRVDMEEWEGPPGFAMTPQGAADDEHWSACARDTVPLLVR
jgi:hypothetical protein